jgi:uncharacterized protein (DUF488 family)
MMSSESQHDQESALQTNFMAHQAITAITIFTIGFGQKSAREFFDILKAAGVRKVIDIRLNNVSQLAGFTKKDDLAYFLEALVGLGYEHHPELAPTKEMLDAYRGGKLEWAAHAERIRRLLAERAVENVLTPEDMDGACLLCSEPEPAQCHRWIVAEYFRDRWGDVTIRHLPE